MSKKTLTGRERKRETSLRVKLADIFAKFTITAAGMGTILAVTGIFAFLAWVVIPLFLPGSFSEKNLVLSPDPKTALLSRHFVMDDYEVLGWSYQNDHSLQVRRLDTGEVLAQHELFPADRQPVSYRFDLNSDQAMFGFVDGSMQTGRIGFSTQFLNFADLDERYQLMTPGDFLPYEDGILELTPTGQFRLQKLSYELQEPLPIAENLSLILVDQTILNSGPVLSSVDESGMFRLQGIRTTRNLMTGEVKQSLSGGQLQLDWPEGKGLPVHLFLEGRADSALIIWKDGYAIRLDTRHRSQPVIAERIQLLNQSGLELTAFGSMIGKMTVITGDSKGQVTSWFRSRPGDAVGGEDPETSDSSQLIQAQVFAPTEETAGQAVTAFAFSHRTRKFLAGFANGTVDLLHTTSQSRLAQIKVFAEPVESLAISPKDNGMLVTTKAGYARYALDFPHPQTTLSAIFTPVWYESASGPDHVWQSTSGTDEFEPKYGMMPLIFGTLKATFYTMLFGAPLALLAAVYTSEFLTLKWRSRIKPIVEMMASLPSVVLGFLAALIFAPLVEQVVPGILAAFITVPFSLLLGAFIWQALPGHFTIKWQSLRFALMGLMIPIGILLAGPLGQVIESLLFAGNIKAWLSFAGPVTSNSPYAAATGGWILLLLPLSAILATVLMVMIVNPFIMHRFAHLERGALARLNLVKFLVGAFVAIGAAYLLSATLNVVGLDARGSYIDTYVQRNALIVGFIMGFAVIPIIYTIAEDALSSVPEFLRAASLGAGATPWQTAIRIIIPTAMSGLFSALMVGFGRAVGETMIVLMAAGNTPVMDWNIFNGFRTLSANIAVELPEAVQNGTNYRMLFLAALTLFLLTFLINTVAELIRQRFRRRAYQL
ncbi:MAG: ABC transporter permease [Oligoflexus sp.]